MFNEPLVKFEEPRGCGYRKEGGAYLVGDVDMLGQLPLCVLIDPPIPVDTEIIPHSRGLYLVDFDAVLTEPCEDWLAGSSKLSLKERDRKAWEIERYGMTLHQRLRTGICKGMSPKDAERELASLQPYRDVFLTDYILAIHRAGKGRRIAREVGKMQEARLTQDWPALLASAWRLTGYSGAGAEVVEKNIQRIMIGVRANHDAIELVSAR